MPRGILPRLTVSLLAVKRTVERLLRHGRRNLLVTGSLSIVLIVVALTILDNSQLAPYLRYVRGYPWLPAILISVALVSLSAVAGLSDQLNQWADDDGVPWPIRLILKILLAADPKLFSPRAWRFLILGTSVSLAGLWLFPQCIGSSDTLVSFRISKGDTIISIPSPGESVSVEPGVTVRLEAEVIPVSREMKLPILECTWMDAGIGGDAKLLRRTGCTVDYLSGRDSIADPVSMQLTQWRCPALESYPFFVERGP